MIRRLCIFGVGLIGGSLARALRKVGAVEEVVGCSRRVAHLEEARQLGVIDRFDTDPERAVAGADMVVIAVPLGAVRPVLAALRPGLADDAVITDVGSAKGSVVADVRAVFGTVPPNFVPGHPIAGTEQSGVAASFPELFEHRRVILTPVAETAPEAVGRVRDMWSRTGAEVVEMSVALHDEVLAATSHLPHLLAFGLVDSLARLQEHQEVFRFAAGGFRDFTRIASSDPVMWRDICLANRDAVLEMLDRFTADLAEMRAAIEAGDGRALLECFQRARRARDEHVLQRKG